MGKKKKTQNDISWNPLQATTIGEIKENKYGWIGTVFLFVLFIGIVFYLPDLLEIYNKFMGNGTTAPISSNISNTNNTTSNNTTNEVQERVVEKYKLSEKKSFEFDSFNVSNIRLFAGNFSYKITNLTNNDLDISSLDYFFEFYNEAGTVIKTIYVTGNIAKDGSENFSHSISDSESIASYSLSVIQEEDFTYYNLEIDENKRGELTCSSDNRQLVYVFEDEKLKKATDKVTYSVELEDYSEKLTYYQELHDKYTEKNGMEVTLDTDEQQLTYSLTIDYNLISEPLDDIVYFQANTSPRVVKFKMEAMGYNCS